MDLSTRAKINQSKLELLKTQNQLEAMKNTIDNEVDVAKNNFISAIATMDYQKKNMTLAGEAMLRVMDEVVNRLGKIRSRLGWVPGRCKARGYPNRAQPPPKVDWL